MLGRAGCACAKWPQALPWSAVVAEARGSGPLLPPELLSRNSHEACSSPRARWRCISPRRERSISGTCLRAKALSGRADDFRDRQYDLTGSGACTQIKWSAAVCTHGELRASDGFGGGRSTSQRDKEGAHACYPIAALATIYTEQLLRVIKKAFAQARQRRGPEHGWAQRQRAKKCSGRAHTPGGGESTARSAGRRSCRRASSGGSERRARESSCHREAPRAFGARPLATASRQTPRRPKPRGARQPGGAPTATLRATSTIWKR